MYILFNYKKKMLDQFLLNIVAFLYMLFTTCTWSFTALI